MTNTVYRPGSLNSCVASGDALLVPLQDREERMRIHINSLKSEYTFTRNWVTIKIMNCCDREVRV